jgi:hypothetical protein
MPRRCRIEFEGAFYHVMDRGDRREAIVGGFNFGDLGNGGSVKVDLTLGLGVAETPGEAFLIPGEVNRGPLGRPVEAFHWVMWLLP